MVRESLFSLLTSQHVPSPAALLLLSQKSLNDQPVLCRKHISLTSQWPVHRPLSIVFSCVVFIVWSECCPKPLKFVPLSLNLNTILLPRVSHTSQLWVNLLTFIQPVTVYSYWTQNFDNCYTFVTSPQSQWHSPLSPISNTNGTFRQLTAYQTCGQRKSLVFEFPQFAAELAVGGWRYLLLLSFISAWRFYSFENNYRISSTNYT
jgi:hypothetical protein